MPNPQTNANLVGTLETLTGIIEHLWNLDAGPLLENLVSAIQASRSLLHASSDTIAQEDDLALAAAQVEELPDFEVDEEEHLADFEEMHAPGAEDDRLETCPYSTTKEVEDFACNDPVPGRQLTHWLFWLYLSRWLWARTSVGRAWPACFDQTCGYPGEGPITTLDEPRMPDQCCAPIQEHLACATARRRTKEKLVGHETCVFCKEALRPRKNCLKCCTCSTWTCSVLNKKSSNAETSPCDSSRPACWPSSIVEAVNVQRATDQGAQLAEQSRTAHRVVLPLVQVADQVEKVRWADIMDVHMSTPRSSETQVQFDPS